MCLGRTEGKVLYPKRIVSIKRRYPLKCYFQSREEKLLKADLAVSPSCKIVDVIVRFLLISSELLEELKGNSIVGMINDQNIYKPRTHTSKTAVRPYMLNLIENILNRTESDELSDGKIHVVITICNNPEFILYLDVVAILNRSKSAYKRTSLNHRNISRKDGMYEECIQGVAA